MARLSQRKSRLVFETDAEKKQRGRYRPIIFEAHPQYVEIRLKGCRDRLSLSYEAIYDFAARVTADKARAEKKAQKARR